MTAAEAHMAEALRLARQALGRTRPNPMVGCVVVRDGEVLARGYHHRAGEAHGEVDALRKLSPGDARGADLYVNLEPCCTHGRTPPCTQAVIDAGIARVFIGTEDTNPRVRGAGIAALRAAGVEVVTGVLQEESRALNLPYFRTMEVGLPWVAAKWAMSLDGKIATRGGDSAWISNERSRERVHRLRDEYDAVLVGAGTLRADDPRLTCRIEGGRNPLRVVLDARLEVGLDARVFEHPGTIVVAGPSVDDAAIARRVDAGAQVVQVDQQEGNGRLDLEQLMRTLVREHQVMSVLVEGGGRVVGAMFDAGLVLRVYAFVAPVLIGGADAPSPVAGLGRSSMDLAERLRNPRIEEIGGDVLIVGDLSDVHRPDQ